LNFRRARRRQQVHLKYRGEWNRMSRRLDVPKVPLPRWTRQWMRLFHVDREPRLRLDAAYFFDTP
jgi:hypothetical protein